MSKKKAYEHYIKKFGEITDEDDIKVVKTRSNTFNNLLGGGVPLGRIITEWGDPGTGKSHIALECCKAVCDSGGSAVFLDFEHSLAPGLFEGIGLKGYQGENFFPLQPEADIDTLQEIIENFTQDDDIDLIVVDSMEAVAPVVRDKDGNKKKISERRPGIKSAQEGAFFQEYKSRFNAKAQRSLLLVEQIRYGFTQSMQSYKTNSGGNAIEHNSDIKFRLRQKNKYTDDDGNVVGADVEVKLEKSSMDNLKTGLVTLRYGKGFDPIFTLCRLMKENSGNLDFYEKRGSWHVLKDDEGNELEKFQGDDSLQEYIKSNQDFVVDKLKSAKAIG